MSPESQDDPNAPRCLVQDALRLADVEEKHRRVRALLKALECDALLLQDPANLSWMTAGVDLSRNAADACQTSVFVTEDARVFATNAVDAVQLFERDAFGLGFQLKQREWFQPHAALISDLCRGRRVASDTGFEGTRAAARQIAALRLPLTELETDRLRRLARVLVHAVEVTCSHVRPGLTEAAIAGELSHRLYRRTVTPVRLQVAADGRNQRYRHWGFGEDPVERFVSVGCVARRWGLHLAVHRTVSCGTVPQELREAHQKAVLMHATGQFFSSHGEQLKAVWPRVQRIYEKFGLPDEWLLNDQADVIGYRFPEQQLTPTAEAVLTGPVPMYWHPAVGPAMPGDTILVTERGQERLTASAAWPELLVQVRGHAVPCPGILVLPEHSTSDVHQPTEPPSFSLQDLPDDDTPAGRVDSIWEIPLELARTVRI
jgi:Xaa-Pro aminopeptidase